MMNYDQAHLGRWHICISSTTVLTSETNEQSLSLYFNAFIRVLCVCNPRSKK